MTRKKVKLAFISNDSARKATFKKRKKGLMKKVSELSTLCGIESCAIVYSPYEAQPDVWPDARGAHRVLAQFKRMPEMEQSKKMVNQESFLRHRISKAADHLKKLHKDNREKEVTHLMFQCLTGKALHGLSLPDLNDMTWLLDQNLKEIYKRIEALGKAPPQPQPQPQPPPHPEAEEEENKAEIDGGVQRRQQQQQQQWFADWMGNPSDHQHQMGGQFGNAGGGGGGGGSGGDEMIVPFNDGNNHTAAMWSNGFFP